jgi:hypothetical protein
MCSKYRQKKKKIKTKTKMKWNGITNLAMVIGGKSFSIIIPCTINVASSLSEGFSPDVDSWYVVGFPSA